MDLFYFLKIFSEWFTFEILKLSSGSHIGLAVDFFVYDSLKIILLLIIINYFMAIIRYYLPIERLRDFLSSRNWYGVDYFIASLFGIITPFCSCSSIPLFIGFLKAGIPLGVTLSFLITSPLVNEIAVILFWQLFGWEITLMYVASGVLLGVFGGMIISKLKLEKYVADYIWEIEVRNSLQSKKKSIKKMLIPFWKEGWALTRKITPYVLVGIAIGSLIHGFVPIGFFEEYISINNPFAVIIAVVVAVPMYANAASVIPVMQALVDKGIPLGTAMAFMMATVGLSLPEALILKKAMKTKLLVVFFTVVAISIIIVGHIFNIIIK